MAVNLDERETFWSDRGGGMTAALCRVELWLNDEEAAAVDGWRQAHRIGDYSDAVRELVRLGLLSEIAKIYRLVADPAE